MLYQIGNWEIEKEPYCDMCKEADIETEERAVPYCSNSLIERMTYHIRCKHLDMCRMVADMMKKREDKEDEQ